MRRKRFSELGRPLPCTVQLPPELAVYIYREKREGNYTDETELVCAIVRDWIKAGKLPKVNWDALANEMIAEQKREDDTEAATRRKGKTG